MVVLLAFVPVELSRRSHERIPLLLERQLREIFLLSLELSCRYAFTNSGLLLELTELFFQRLVLGFHRLRPFGCILELHNFDSVDKSIRSRSEQREIIQKLNSTLVLRAVLIFQPSLLLGQLAVVFSP